MNDRLQIPPEKIPGPQRRCATCSQGRNASEKTGYIASDFVTVLSYTSWKATRKTYEYPGGHIVARGYSSGVTAQEESARDVKIRTALHSDFDFAQIVVRRHDHSPGER